MVVQALDEHARAELVQQLGRLGLLYLLTIDGGLDVDRDEVALVGRPLGLLDCPELLEHSRGLLVEFRVGHLG